MLCLLVGIICFIKFHLYIIPLCLLFCHNTEEIYLKHGLTKNIKIVSIPPKVFNTEV